MNKIKTSNDNKKEDIEMNTYVIVDSEGAYADKDSLFINKNKKLRYTPSKTIINGCCYFNDINIAKTHLDLLNKIANIHNINFGFIVKNINYKEEIKKELKSQQIH